MKYYEVRVYAGYGLSTELVDTKHFEKETHAVIWLIHNDYTETDYSYNSNIIHYIGNGSNFVELETKELKFEKVEE